MKLKHSEIERKKVKGQNVEEVRSVLETNKSTIASAQRDISLADALNSDPELVEMMGGPVQVVSVTKDDLDYNINPEVLGHIRGDTKGAETAGEHGNDYIAAVGEYLTSDQYKAKKEGAHYEKVWSKAKPSKNKE